MNNQNFKLDGRTIVIGLLLIVAAVIFLPRLFNTGGDNIPETNNTGDLDPNEAVEIGSPVTALAIDRDGCPTQTTSTFEPADEVYVVAPNSDVPTDTEVFVRLYHNDTPVEDAPQIVADQDYNNTCINFVFEPVDGGFDPGSYEAEFIINGNPGPSVNFVIR